MRRVRNSFISIFLAALIFGAAISEASTGSDSGVLGAVTELLAEVRETVVVPFGAEKRPKTYPQVVQQMDGLLAYADRIEEGGRAAVDLIQTRLQEVCPDADAIRVDCALTLDWKTIGTLLFTYGERMPDVLKQNLCMRIEAAGDAIEVQIAFANFDAMLWLDNETDWFAARNSYYYLNTVYDDDGTLRKPTCCNLPQEKLDSLAFPLDAKWYSRIKTTWFRSRDRGARMHTGMDIRCASGSPIYACAGGTVNSVGYHVKGGYYVSVADADGFEYFYYHMKKNSQCVVRGQTVETGERLGLSGNTGNSAAPHLHLSIITPDRRFVDPFPIYYRWVYQHTGKRIKKPS